MPDITLYFLQASRSIRTAWVLEKLKLAYELEFAPRENNKAPQAFKDASGHALGKFPVLRDGSLTMGESGAIAEYLCERYDGEGELIPRAGEGGDLRKRAKVLEWVHAAEGTFMMHALPITYARWFTPERARSDGTLAALESALSANVQKDLDWLDGELARGGTSFLCGDEITAADIMLHFSVQFIVARRLGTEGRRWENVHAWMTRLAKDEAYKRAVERTGYTL